MKMMWMIVFFALPLLGIVYCSWHVWAVLPFGPWLKALVVALGILAFLLMFFNLAGLPDRLPMPLARAAYNVGFSSIFVMLYLVMLFLVLDAGRLCGLVPRAWLHNNGTASLAILALMAAIFIGGNLHYRHKTRHTLELTTTKQLDRPLKVVLLSDLHLGYHNPRKELARWVDMINKEKADAILIAGDIVDGSMRPLNEEQTADEFLRLNAPVYACLGNHEYYSGEPDAEKFYRQADIRLLRDQVANEGRLCIMGRDDRTNRRRQSVAQLAQKADHERFTILMDHQPYQLEEAEQAGIDFQLSGHTHHGQVWPISWITDAIYECAFGQHQRGNTHYYVSSGIGIWGGKYRIGTCSEYVVATIRQQKAL